MVRFLSTLPARGATTYWFARSGSLLFLSTLPARGATLRTAISPRLASIFLSTLPARGATGIPTGIKGISVFLSTLPARGATPWARRGCRGWRCYFYPRSPRGERHPRLVQYNNTCLISIHAPREGSDRGQRRAWPLADNFYPRSPRGERHRSTRKRRQMEGISIHAPREGSD